MLSGLRTSIRMKDVAIIGGGPAGAMAAQKLAAHGFQVTVFEEKRGWEKPCGGGLPYKALRRYPFLLDAAEPHTVVRDAELVAANGGTVRFRLREPLVIYSRAALNRLLLARAEDAGAGVVVDRILDFRRDGAGWKLRGRHADYTADYLVLAAGARSRLRGILTPHLEARDFMLTFGYYTPLSASLRERGLGNVLRVQFFADFEGYAWAFPRCDHLSLGLCGKVGESRMAELRERLGGFMHRFGYVPPGADSAARGPVFSHLLPALSIERWNDLRLSGAGWALAGDAGGLVDPVTGEGIYFALRSGELLADALAERAPESYAERVWRDFGKRLALGARLARRFYHGKFFGEFSTTRMVQFARRSPTFLGIVQNLIDGSQSYSGLAGRLYLSLSRALIEMALVPLRTES